MISTIGFEIRKYKPQDIAPFYEAVIASYKAIHPWLPWCNSDYSKTHASNWITEIVPKIWSEKKGCEFVIAQLETQNILGGCCLEQLNLDNKTANIGYWVRTSATGQGLATQACYFLLNYGFNTLNLQVINVIPSVENIPSIRVAEKLPYTNKYLVSNGFQIRDSISDALVFEFQKSNWNASS